jgi:hypothetical protein
MAHHTVIGTPIPAKVVQQLFEPWSAAGRRLRRIRKALLDLDPLPSGTIREVLPRFSIEELIAQLRSYGVQDHWDQVAVSSSSSSGDGNSRVTPGSNHTLRLPIALSAPTTTAQDPDARLGFLFVTRLGDDAWTLYDV